VDSLDWRDYGVKFIVNTVVDHEYLGNGSIILCHNGAKYTKDALESMMFVEEIYGKIVVYESVVFEYKMCHFNKRSDNHIVIIFNVLLVG
jgi:hypothetical protein